MRFKEIPMKFPLAILLGLMLSFDTRAFMVSETVYVEAPTDTDNDGKLDRIFVSIDRPSSDKKLSTIFSISPYALGGNNGPMHDVDVELLPQDAKSFRNFFYENKTLKDYQATLFIQTPRYAQLRAHSVGTGRSTGCPTVGDMSETLAAKAVIDWLNGRAKAFYENGKEARADWANGFVGMTGTSYDGTLPIMVATTGVEGLKAIVPIAAISNWYDYYRANGLVVNPGGYIGEDADVLGYFIMRKGSCQTQLDRITKTMGREHGDFSSFWQARDYLPKIKDIKAATFIIHGQNDWNVKQKHAIQLWEGLEGVAPRRIFLHRGGHGSTWNHQVPRKLQAWFDHFLEGEENGINNGPQVEVELPDGTLVVQREWPHENAQDHRLYLSSQSTLTLKASAREILSLMDNGRTQKVEGLIENPTQRNDGRLIFLSAPMERSQLLSGTPKVHLELAIMNRKAANLTIAVVEYDKQGRGRIITRGWADPQNYRDITRGESLIPGKTYQLSFELEPKQYRLKSGSRLGILIASTDYEYTLRPKPGTMIQFFSGENSFIELKLAQN
jgi:X-Pro dipeptidyl-peptidase